ncbi:MAG: NUDIX hydrolase [Pseudomonadota bacterium]
MDARDLRRHGHPRAMKLHGAARDTSFPNRVPVDAASLILLRQGQRGPAVLMGRRHDRHKFMPGVFVFPGGRIDREDAIMPACTEPTPALLSKVQADMKGRPSLARARGLLLAAIRETFEETGIALGRTAHQPLGPAGRHESWSEFAELGLRPDPSELVPIARAITPPRRPRRFDTRFFALDGTSSGLKLDPHRPPSEELDSIQWVSFDAVSELPVAAITSTILDELREHLEAEGGLSSARPMPYYRVVHRYFHRSLLA